MRDQTSPENMPNMAPGSENDFSGHEQEETSQDLKPRLPEWFKKNQEDNYKEVLLKQIEQMGNNPDAYFGEWQFGTGEIDEEGEEKKISWKEIKEQYGIDSDGVRRLALEAQEIVTQDFSFEKIGQQVEKLFKGLNQTPDGVSQDFQKISETIVRRTHLAVLRRMVREYIPRHEVVLHRGNFKSLRKKIAGNSGDKVTERLNKMGNLGLLVKFILMDTSYKVEKIQENIEQGIGGFEFDVNVNSKGDLVVTHAHQMSKLDKAPTLESLLDSVRELLPDDKDASMDKRRARRGLKLFLDLKISPEDKETTEKILRLLDSHNLTGQTHIMTGRPEIIYSVDEVDEKLSQEDSNHKSAKFSFRSVPLPEKTAIQKSVGKVLERLGLADRYKGDELRSISKAVEEIHLLTEWPPHGRLMEILRKHKGSTLNIPAAYYNKDMLPQAQKAGVDVHVGVFDREELIEEILSPDASGLKPKGVMSTSKKVVFPEKK